jgi:hypothetical protein
VTARLNDRGLGPAKPFKASSQSRLHEQAGHTCALDSCCKSDTYQTQRGSHPHGAHHGTVGSGSHPPHRLGAVLVPTPIVDEMAPRIGQPPGVIQVRVEARHKKDCRERLRFQLRAGCARSFTATLAGLGKRSRGGECYLSPLLVPSSHSQLVTGLGDLRWTGAGNPLRVCHSRCNAAAWHRDPIRAAPG